MRYSRLNCMGQNYLNTYSKSSDLPHKLFFKRLSVCPVASYSHSFASSFSLCMPAAGHLLTCMVKRAELDLFQAKCTDGTIPVVILV